MERGEEGGGVGGTKGEASGEGRKMIEYSASAPRLRSGHKKWQMTTLEGGMGDAYDSDIYGWPWTLSGRFFSIATTRVTFPHPSSFGSPSSWSGGKKRHERLVTLMALTPDGWPISVAGFVRIISLLLRVRGGSLDAYPVWLGKHPSNSLHL